MKRVELTSCSKEMVQFSQAAQKEHIVLLRNGEPFAMIIGLENKDDEDIELQSSSAFWQMIQERRRETKMYTIEEVEKMLGITEKPKRARKAKVSK